MICKRCLRKQLFHSCQCGLPIFYRLTNSVLKETVNTSNWFTLVYSLESFKCKFLEIALVYLQGDVCALRRTKETTIPWLLMVSERGMGKRVPLRAFPRGVLGRVGVIGCKVSSILNSPFHRLYLTVNYLKTQGYLILYSMMICPNYSRCKYYVHQGCRLVVNSIKSAKSLDP